ncbi:MAG: cyclic nucleotide-binding domain-containing protein [Deinococcales bacterium]
MMLLTLGKLELASHNFKRTKSLALFAYLLLEGRQSRDYLARLFWPNSQEAKNNLTVTLFRLRKALGKEIISYDAHYAEAFSDYDIAQIYQALREKSLDKILNLYQGPFCLGIHFEGHDELNEWLLEKRHDLAQELSHVLLDYAEGYAWQNWQSAADLAARIYQTTKEEGLDATELRRLHTLLFVNQHPYSQVVAQAYAHFEDPQQLYQDPAKAKTYLQRLSLSEQVDKRDKIYLELEKLSLLQRCYSLKDKRSLAYRTEEEKRHLDDLGQRLWVLELIGLALNESVGLLEQSLHKLHQQGAQVIILDAHRLRHIDIDILSKLSSNPKSYQLIWVCPLDNNLSPPFTSLLELGTGCHRDLDRALEEGENLLLYGKTQRLLPELESLTLEDFSHLELSKADTSYLYAHLEVKTYLPQEAIIRQGQEDDGLYFLTSGIVEVVIQKPNTPEKRIDSYSAGLMFGEVARYAGKKRTATVKALTEVSCYRLSREHLDRLMLEKPKLAEYLLKALSHLMAQRVARLSAALGCH